jgi:GAF domain-containing protein
VPDNISSAEQFGRLAVELHDVHGVLETVDAAIQFTLQAIRCDYASVVVIDMGRRPEIMASTHPGLEKMYREQLDTGTGPLITATQEHQVVKIPDVLAELRWSQEWVDQAVCAGIRSSLHVPLSNTMQRRSAVLSLYRVDPDPFTDDDIAITHILARHAAVAISAARKYQNLATAVDARKLVGQAMGILMERYNFDSDRAFEVLRRYSQDTNTKLRDVAQELIDSRRLPS